MADIKQAAQWLREGKRVRRAEISRWVHTPKKDSNGVFDEIHTPPSMLPNMNVSDLLAEDWEIDDPEEIA